jgi:hypothetical protein
VGGDNETKFQRRRMAPKPNRPNETQPYVKERTRSSSRIGGRTHGVATINVTINNTMDSIGLAWLSQILLGKMYVVFPRKDVLLAINRFTGTSSHTNVPVVGFSFNLRDHCNQTTAGTHL